MKTEKLNFQWFEKEDRRKPLRASLGRDRKLRLGEELRKKLPPQLFDWGLIPKTESLQLEMDTAKVSLGLKQDT